MYHKYNFVVFIGRFQPSHLAHIRIISKALEKGEKVIILIGSSNQVRTIKNPWTFEERKQMILSAFPSSVHDNLLIHPLHDKIYNDQQWVCEVQHTVGKHTKDGSSIAIVGHNKDESSYYLDLFPQWDLIDMGLIKEFDVDLNATDIRDDYFQINPNNENLLVDLHQKIGTKVSPSIEQFLQMFQLRNEHALLIEEYEFLKKYKSAWENSPYPPTFVTVDAVVVQSGHVLLVQRRAMPGQGTWAMPGGFLGQNETVIDATIRELREETKLKVPEPVLKGSIKASKIFDHPARSLRGRTITHASLIELRSGELPKVKGSDDAAKSRWIPLNIFYDMENQMFEDHWHIVSHFLGNL